MNSKTGNVTHDNNIIAAEGVRQQAMVGTPSAATAKAADIAFFRAGRASALANGVGPTEFIRALMELGTGGQ